MNDELEVFQEDVKAFLEYLSIPILSNDTNYWFLRTASGQKFQDFFQGSYVGISWDFPELNNIDYLKKASKDEIKEIISKLDPDETRPGLAASTIQKFIIEMKPSDFVLIPSENSEYIAFGQIAGDPYLYEPTDQDRLFSFLDDPDNNPIGSEFLKRREVKWIGNPHKRTTIDPIIVNLIYSHNTLVDANPYKNYINRTLFDAYYQDGLFHGTFNVKKQGNIPAIDLGEFIHTITDQSYEVANLAQLEQRKDELDLRLTLNSPGVIEFITGYAPYIFCVCFSILIVAGGEIDFKGFKFKSPGLIKAISDYQKEKQNRKFAEEHHNLDVEKMKLRNLKESLKIRNSQEYKNVFSPEDEDVSKKEEPHKE